MPSFQALEEMLWPRCLKCLCCDELSEGTLLCEACQRELHGERLPQHEWGAVNVRSTFRYEGRAKQLVLALKLECVADAAQALAKDMAASAEAWNLPADTVLTWVTMPPRRFRQRGIDHGRELCLAVAKRLNLPARQLMIRTKRIHTQRGLSHEKRLQNLTGTMACPEHIDTPVLLIDDVLTTGATVAACAAALRNAGAPNVYALTATKVMLHDND